MNTHRVFLHDLLWEQDSIGFLERIDKFLEISDRYGIKTLLVFFDDVWHPVPKLGNNLSQYLMFIILDGCNLLEQKFYMIL